MQNKDDYALVVGVGWYPALARAAPRAEEHARQIAGWLTSPCGGGLPSANVIVLARPVQSIDRTPGPQLYQIHRALRGLGVSGGGRAGRRLYICFAGCALGRTAGDVQLLTADVDLDTSIWPRLSIEALRQQIAAGGAYEELVLLAELERLEAPEDLQLLCNLGPAQSKPSQHFQEFVAVGDVVLQDALAVFEETRLLEPTWRLKASDLAVRMRERSSRHGPEGAWLELTYAQHSRAGTELTFGSAEASDAPAAGTLVVETPHWSTVVTALDHRLRPIAQAGLAEREGAGHYAARLLLPVGVYTVEAQLGGSTERRPVLVAPRQEVRVDMSAPEQRGSARAGSPAEAIGLVLPSAAPLSETPTTRKWHAHHAVEMSNRLTWEPPDALADPQASGLLVFVRTLKPQRFRRFAEGLTLLSSSGKLIVRLSSDVAVFGKGCMAFHTRLPPGGYVLRCEARGGAPLRHQPVHLCPDWDTQVFIGAEDTPALHGMAYHLVRPGTGFDPDDRALAVAQALFNAMRTGLRQASFLAVSDALLPVIRGRMEDAPWLAVLAAYALDAGCQGGASMPGEEEMLTELLRALGDLIGSHPDVRALHLRYQEVAAVPADLTLSTPPMLRAGIRRVLQQATRLAGILPPRSLTARIANDLVADSPWTAWGDSSARPVEETSRSSEILASAFPPKAPVFRLGLAPSARSLVRTPAAPILDTLADLPLVKAARDVAARIDAGVDPGSRISVDFDDTTERLLASTDPAAVGAALGLPVGKVELGLNRLRRAVMDESAVSAAGGENEDSDDEIVLGYVLNLAEHEEAAKADSVARTTIEACATALLAEAEQLEEVAVSEVAARLRHAAQELLKRADFIILKSESGRRVNGALQILRATKPQRGTAGGTRSDSLGESLDQALELDEAELQAEVQAVVGSLSVTRTVIERGPDGTEVGRITVMRDKSSRLSTQAMADVDALLPRLSLFASLRVHGARAQWPEYDQKLDEIVGEIERLL